MYTLAIQTARHATMTTAMMAISPAEMSEFGYIMCLLTVA